MFNLRKILPVKLSHGTTLNRLRQTEKILQLLIDSLPDEGNQEEYLLDLFSLNRTLAIVHMMMAVGESAEEIKLKLAQKKEHWIHDLLLSAYDPRGLFEDGNVLISLN